MWKKPFYQNLFSFGQTWGTQSPGMEATSSNGAHPFGVTNNILIEKPLTVFIKNMKVKASMKTIQE